MLVFLISKQLYIFEIHTAAMTKCLLLFFLLFLVKICRNFISVVCVGVVVNYLYSILDVTTRFKKKKKKSPPSLEVLTFNK